VDARRQPAIQTAPQVLYTNREPPMELRGVAGLKDSENIGYVTFGRLWNLILLLMRISS
jgi:actin related protein 2/3 complex subunit 2